MASKEQRFRKGDTVHHPHYGEGEILEAEFNAFALYRPRSWRSAQPRDVWFPDKEL